MNCKWHKAPCSKICSGFTPFRDSSLVSGWDGRTVFNSRAIPAVKTSLASIFVPQHPETTFHFSAPTVSPLTFGQTKNIPSCSPHWDASFFLSNKHLIAFHVPFVFPFSQNFQKSAFWESFCQKVFKKKNFNSILNLKKKPNNFALFLNIKCNVDAPIYVRGSDPSEIAVLYRSKMVV